MRPIVKQSDKRTAFTPLETKPHPLGVVKKRGGGLGSHPGFLTGFTIIELMTVMSVIIILIGLLVPGLNQLRRYAKDVAQRNQFYAIGLGLETFNAEWDSYPSSKIDLSGVDPYSGANRLADAMVGEDLLGYDPTGTYIDPNSSARRQYLPVEKANAYKLGDLWQPLIPMPSVGKQRVLCDVYSNVTYLGLGKSKSVGMPVLYYKASTSGAADIYNYEDNLRIVALTLPWKLGDTHPFDVDKFNEQIRNDEIWENSGQTFYKPCRADSYILLSAGHDGKYGTGDDVFNFRK
ncbi:MAG: type II secretion system protein [Planctomycetota bacterium]